MYNNKYSIKLYKHNKNNNTNYIKNVEYKFKKYMKNYINEYIKQSSTYNLILNYYLSKRNYKKYKINNFNKKNTPIYYKKLLHYKKPIMYSEYPTEFYKNSNLKKPISYRNINSNFLYSKGKHRQKYPYQYMIDNCIIKSVEITINNIPLTNVFDREYANMYERVCNPTYDAHDLIANYYFFRKNLKNLQEALRTYKRTAIFRDELIYRPNIGYKYFESLLNFSDNSYK